MSIKAIRLALAATAASVAFAPASLALSSYSQDFEGLVQTDGAALGADGWKVFGNVFEGNGAYRFGFGVFDAPNGGDSWSAIDAGQGGPDQGGQQLSVYNIYSCCDLGTPAPLGHGNGTDIVEALVFQEQVVSSSDIGSTWEFSFDVKGGNIEGASTADAFIKTLDPNAGFAQTNFVSIDTTNIGDTWTRLTLSLFIDGSLDGQILQFGFSNRASNFEGSGMFYDNVNFSQVPLPGALVFMASGLLGLFGIRRRNG